MKETTKTAKTEAAGAETWRAVGYVRLSREDEARGESGSIASQRILIEDWAARRGNVEVLAFYADDGYSGATFARPAFERMMDDAKEAAGDDPHDALDLSSQGVEVVQGDRLSQFPAVGQHVEHGVGGPGDGHVQHDGVEEHLPRHDV